MFEGEPGLFYVLTINTTPTWGPAILTVTSAGASNLIYTFAPPTSHGLSLLQATNHLIYGAAGFPNFYYSITPSGKNLMECPLPGAPPKQWGSDGETIAAPTGNLYDIVGLTVGNYLYFGFARITESGEITILYHFPSTGFYPSGANLVYGPDGNIYGIGTEGANQPPGYVFRFTPSGSYSKLLTFPSFPTRFASAPPLVAAADGNLYGTLRYGGTNKTGEIFKVTLSGQYQTVASFPATGLNEPTTLMQAADDNFYGSAAYGSSSDIYRYDPTTGQVSSVYRLDPTGSQGECGCKLMEGMDGKIYAVTPIGGNSGGVGAVFSLNIGLPKPAPVISGLYPLSGPVGQRVVLWGNYLLGATLVTFNGLPAGSVTLGSAQSVTVTVPTGATTGPVTITTANGSFTTAQNFTVQ